MTRQTAPIKHGKARLVIEVDQTRDESDSYRHKWVTRLRLGELTGAGANTREAAENLAAELRALAECTEAVEAMAKVRHKAIERCQREEKEAAQAAEVARWTSGCSHFALEDGPRMPLVHGSWPTKVCRSCGAWRVAVESTYRLDGQPAWRIDDIAVACREDEDE